MSLRSQRFLLAEAIPSLARGLPRRQNSAARSDICILVKTLAIIQNPLANG
jgi:hypothetical protein